MPRLTIRFALIALLLAAIVPTATGIGVSAYLNARATVELLWQDLADEMIEAVRAGSADCSAMARAACSEATDSAYWPRAC